MEAVSEQYPVKTAYHLIVTAELTPDEEEGGYSVYCPELDIYTQGETVEEAIASLREAAEGYIEVVGLDLSPCPPVSLSPGLPTASPSVGSQSPR